MNSIGTSIVAQGLLCGVSGVNITPAVGSGFHHSALDPSATEYSVVLGFVVGWWACRCDEKKRPVWGFCALPALLLRGWLAANKIYMCGGVAQ